MFGRQLISLIFKVNVFRAYWRTDKKDRKKTGRNEKKTAAIEAIDPDNYTDYIFQLQ